MLGMTDGVIVFVVHHVVGGIAVAETVREDLVLHRALGPVRNVEARHEAESVGGIEVGDIMFIGAYAVFVIGNFRSVRTLNQETVDDLGFAADDAGRVIIKVIVTLFLFHHGPDGERFEEKDDTLRTALCDPQVDADGVAAVRFRRKTVVRRLVAEDGGKNGVTDSHGKPS